MTEHQGIIEGRELLFLLPLFDPDPSRSGSSENGDNTDDVDNENQGKYRCGRCGQLKVIFVSCTVSPRFTQVWAW